MKFTWATRITLMRIFLIAPFVMLMLNINKPEYPQSQRHFFRYLATAIFLVMAISDGIDGYLARRRHQVTKLGAFLDPLADKLLMTCACLLLASERAMVPGFKLPIEVVVMIIGKDMFLLIGFFVVFLFTQQVRVLPVRIGKVATALQLVMVAAILLAPEISGISEPFRHYIWFLRALWWSAAGTAILATAIYIRAGSGYIEEAEKTNGAR
jgi:CDP-diacylglycerol--glycerol-3-phosphate 3-phosphatidyltransferase/cardiolipin synthase